MSQTVDRARDLLSALEILSNHRREDPGAYRQVHTAAVEAVTAVHRSALDPRGPDLDSTLAAYGELVRRLRALPTERPAPPPSRPSRGGADLSRLIGRTLGGASSVDTWLGEVTRGIGPEVERTVRDGLRDLFGPAFDPGRGDDPDRPADAGTDAEDHGGDDASASSGEDLGGDR